MRLPLALAALALAASFPAAAADRTESISLKYVSPTELETVLLGNATLRLGPGALRNGGLGGGGFGSGLGGGGLGGGGTKVPRGITALTANDRDRVLTVSGSEEAIVQVKNLVRLVDIPPRQIQVTVRGLELKPAPLPDDVLNLGNSEIKVTAPLSPEQLAAVEGRVRASVLTVDITCSNNRPVRLFWPKKDPLQLTEVIPRVNGDGTVTLFMPMQARTDGKEPEERSLFALRRIRSGETVLLALEGSTKAVLLSARVLPEVR